MKKDVPDAEVLNLDCTRSVVGEAGTSVRVLQQASYQLACTKALLKEASLSLLQTPGKKRVEGHTFT